jgi:sulfur carrier protein
MGTRTVPVFFEPDAVSAAEGKTIRPCFTMVGEKSNGGSASRAPHTHTMNLHINDQPRTLDLGADATLAALLAHIGQADRKGIAVAVNDNVIPRAAWPAHPLAEADRILIIQATQGG